MEYNNKQTALKDFDKSDKKGKRVILKDLGSNQKIIDKKVMITMRKSLLPIYENANRCNAEIARLEPALALVNKRQNDPFGSLRPIWLGVTDDVRTKMNKNYNLM